MSSDEVNDVVYLLTRRDEDARDGRWTVVASARTVKSRGDMATFELDRIIRGRSATSVSTCQRRNAVVTTIRLEFNSTAVRLLVEGH